MTVLGYRVNCDDSYCVDCWNGGIASDFEAYDPHEEWGYDYPAIFSDEESDSPTHCDHCGELIPHNLTDDGIFYVLEAIEGCIGEGKKSEVAVEWVKEYSERFDPEQCKEILLDLFDRCREEFRIF